MKRRIFLNLILLSVLWFGILTVHAEDGVTWYTDSIYTTPIQAQQMYDKNWFDPIYYMNNYPDVAAIVGNDTLALYQHYLTCGKAEGRIKLDPAGCTYVHILHNAFTPEQLDEFSRQMSAYVMQDQGYWTLDEVYGNSKSYSYTNIKGDLYLKVPWPEKDKDIDELKKVGLLILNAVGKVFNEPGCLEVKIRSSDSLLNQGATININDIKYLGYYDVIIKFDSMMKRGESIIIE